MNGFVYILDNEYMPDLIKIGCSERSPHTRAQELSGSTAIPAPFRVLCYAEFADFQAVEKSMHEWCKEHRIATNREFFTDCLTYAVQLLYWNPKRLSFTDVTAASGMAQWKSELLQMAEPSDELVRNFDDLRNPFGDAEEEKVKQIAREQALVELMSPAPAPLPLAAPETADLGAVH